MILDEIYYILPTMNSIKGYVSSLKKAFLTLFIIIMGYYTALASAYGKKNDPIVDALFASGKSYYEQGDYTEAIGEFKRCLLVQPDCSDCQKYLILAERISEIRQGAIITALEETRSPEQKMTEETKTFQEQGLVLEETVPKTDKGAWTLPEGKLYCELYNKYYWHKSEFNDKGKRTNWSANGHYNEIRAELKLEYGLTDDLTLLLYLPYKEAHWHDDNAKYTTKGIVDIWTGAKYRLFSEPFVLSLQTRVKIPTHYNEHDTPSLGRRQVDGEIKLLLGKSLVPFISGYTKAELGFRARNEEPTNQIPYFYELGYNLTDYLTLKATLDGVEGISGTGKIDEDYIKWTLGPICKIGDYAIELGYGNTFAGKNSSAAEEVILSLSSQF